MNALSLYNGLGTLMPHGDSQPRNALHHLTPGFATPLWADLIAPARVKHVVTGTAIGGGERPLAAVVNPTTGAVLPVFSLPLVSTDTYFGHLVDVLPWEIAGGETLAEVDVTVTATSLSGASGPAPDAFWTSYALGTQVYIELSSIDAPPVPGTRYDIAIAHVSTLGIARALRLISVVCRM